MDSRPLPRDSAVSRSRPPTVAEQRFADHARELTELDLTERFARIYATNLWSDVQSRSGPGSSLDATRVIRARLPQLVRDLGAKSLLDVPCGDFAWLQHVDLTGIEYTGGDIVPALVAENEQRHATESRRFMMVDLTRDRLPSADVLLCRDCLVHLSYANIRAALTNIAHSGVQFLLMTSFPGRNENYDIVDGDWRPLDFGAEPFGFPAPVATLVEECSEADGAYADKSLVVWRVSDIPRHELT